jgi:hypothetical protein
MAIRRKYGEVVVNHAEPDELPQAGRLLVAGEPTRFGEGNKSAAGRKPGMAKLGVPIHMCNVTDVRYKKLLRDASTYRKHRCAELLEIHGYVSAGASSMIASASLSLAASKWMYALASEHTGGPDGLVKLVGLASKLAGDAKHLELTAWEIAAREAASWKATMGKEDLPPWLTSKDPPKRGE